MEITREELLDEILEWENKCEFSFLDEFEYEVKDKFEKSNKNLIIDNEIISYLKNKIEYFDIGNYDELYCYDDCYDFLKENDIFDWELAIENGCSNLVGIANYYYQEKELEELEKFKKYANSILNEYEQKLKNENGETYAK